MALSRAEQEIIGKIKYIARDKRERVLVADQLDWMEAKMAEITKLVRKLPGRPWQAPKPSSRQKD